MNGQEKDRNMPVPKVQSFRDALGWQNVVKHPRWQEADEATRQTVRRNYFNTHLKNKTEYLRLKPPEQTAFVQSWMYGKESAQESAYQSLGGFPKFSKGAIDELVAMAKGLGELGSAVYHGGNQALGFEQREEGESNPLWSMAKGVFWDAPRRQFEKAGEAWDQPGLLPKVKAAGHTAAGAMPLLGPWAADLGESIGEDPAYGLGRTAVGVGTLGVGGLLKSKTAAYGERVADARRFAGSGKGTGLPPTMALEKDPASFMGGIARTTSGTPIGSKMTETAVHARNPSVVNVFEEILRKPEVDPGAHVKSAAEGLVRKSQTLDEATKVQNMIAAETATRKAAVAEAQRFGFGSGTQGGTTPRPSRTGGPEAQGKLLAESVQRRYGKEAPEGVSAPPSPQPGTQAPRSIRQMVTDLWTPLNEAFAEIPVEMANTIEATRKIFNLSEKGRELLTSTVSQPVHKLLQKVMKQEEGAQLPSWMSEAPEAFRQNVLAELAEVAGETTPTWSILKEARSQVGAMIETAKRRKLNAAVDSLPDADMRTLAALYDSMGKDLRVAVDAAGGEWSNLFKTATNTTREMHAQYGTGMPGKIISKAIAHEKIIPELVGGTVADARHFIKSLGLDAEALSTFKAATVEDLMRRSIRRSDEAGLPKVDYNEALTILEKNKYMYREILGPQEFNRLVRNLGGQRAKYRARIERKPAVTGKAATELDYAKRYAKKAPEEIIPAMMAQAKGRVAKVEGIHAVVKMLGGDTAKIKNLQSGGFRWLLDQSTEGGTFGKTGALFDGISFRDKWNQYRGHFKAMGLEEAHLKDLDAVAEHFGRQKYTRATIQAMKDRGSKVGGLVEKGVFLTAIIAAVKGEVGAALAASTYLIGPKALLRVFIQPEGAKLLGRALKMDRRAPKAGATVNRLMQLAALKPARTAKKAQEGMPKNEEYDYDPKTGELILRNP